MAAESFALSLVLAGLLGSVHCVAMCGAFAAAAGRRGLGASLLYSAGRLTAYGSLGALAGGLGAGLQLALAPLSVGAMALALLAGLALAGLGLRGLLPAGGAAQAAPLGWLYERLAPLTRACLAVRRRDEAYLLGLLNGLLPCPIVTPLLLAALASGSAGSGSALLVALGVGTVPAMLAAGLVVGQALRPTTGPARIVSSPIRAGLLSRLPSLALLALGLLTAARPFLAAAPPGHLH